MTTTPSHISIEMQLLAEKVIANHQRLNSCIYHEFKLIDRSISIKRHQQYVCIHCHGEINGNDYHWHEAGRREKTGDH